MLICSTSRGRCSRSRSRWSESHFWSAGTNPAGVCRWNDSGGSSPVGTGSVWLPSEALESACIRQSSTGSTNAGATAGPNLHSSHGKRIPPTGAEATLQEGSDRRSECQVRRAASLASLLSSWPGFAPAWWVACMSSRSLRHHPHPVPAPSHSESWLATTGFCFRKKAATLARETR